MMGRPRTLVRRAALRSLSHAVIAISCALPTAAIATDPGLVVIKPANQKVSACGMPAEPILQPYEPITGGYTHDSNDTGFYDVNLSVKVRLLPWCSTPAYVHPYFAMATRFGFYWGSRPNSPVIGKSYNPVLLLRFIRPNQEMRQDHQTFERRDYIDVIPYAHQSNGQLIHTQEEYETELQSLQIPSYTNNFIHRGWDYVGIVWKKSWTEEFAAYLEGRYFLQNGLLQGPPNEYQSWEDNPQGKPRRAVDGLSATIEFPTSYAHFVVDPSEDPCLRDTTVQHLICRLRPNITVKYLTGYDTPFKYSTGRVEFGFQVLTLPLVLWIQHGYMSSLAMYYEKVTSTGIQVRFQSW
jgi:hypothetical protein